MNNNKTQVIIHHNLDPKKFVWLWAKYVTDFNEKYHCTNSIKGKYSKKLSKHNTNVIDEKTLILDEQPIESYKAIYICGVASKGYSKKLNYPHNLHTVILPKEGCNDKFTFEEWELSVENGMFLKIPSMSELPSKYKVLPDEYITCRIFRWAACYFDIK